MEGKNSVAELIWNGKQVRDDSHLEQLRERFLGKLAASEDPESIRRGFNSCRTETDRIQFVQKYFEWMHIPDKLIQRLGKNAELSTSFREKANAEYKAGNLAGAKRGYNLAVSFGRSGGEELGLAYANRSALFLHIKEPQLALKDIEFALQNNFPVQLRPKLLEREKKCQALLEELRRTQERDLSEAGEFCQKRFFTLKCPSKNIVGAEDFVSITSTPERGRCVVVTKDVKAGSPILIEKPYVTMLERELCWDTEHCQHCLKRMNGGVPCAHCTFAMYCDEHCLSEAATYHQYEHQLWGYLHAIEASRRDLLATRIISKLAPSNLLKLFEGDQTIVTTSAVSVPGFDENGVYDSRTYGPIYHLLAHREGQELCDEVSLAFKALLLTNLLKEYSKFFTDFTEKVDELVTFTASIILRHLENIPYNAISLSELQSASPTSNGLRNQENSIKSVCYASAIFGLLAMCNHSCSPNAVHVRRGGGQLTSLVTLRNLSAGEEVCITYGPLFTVHPLEERLSTLRQKYNFVCDCDACVNRWILSDSMPGVSSPQVLLQLSKYEELLQEQLHQLNNSNDLIPATVGLLPCLEFFGSHFPPTFPLTQVAQDLFKKALVRLANSNYMNCLNSNGSISS